MRTWRDHIRLDEPIQSRPCGRELRDIIIGEVLGRPVISKSPDCDHIGRVAGHPHTHGCRTRVADARDDHNTSLPGCHDSQVVRICPIGSDGHRVH